MLLSKVVAKAKGELSNLKKTNKTQHKNEQNNTYSTGRRQYKLLSNIPFSFQWNSRANKSSHLLAAAARPNFPQLTLGIFHFG
jgi:hypothetical protein